MRGAQVTCREAARSRRGGEAAISGQSPDGKATQPAQDRQGARGARPRQREWEAVQRQVRQEHDQGSAACLERSSGLILVFGR